MRAMSWEMDLVHWVRCIERGGDMAFMGVLSKEHWVGAGCIMIIGADGVDASTSLSHRSQLRLC